jgi:sodium transport system ATP-binding protein
MIEVTGLTKSFPSKTGRVTAVDDVFFQVKPGEIFGLLGPNGAGKTTTLRMLCTLLKPTAGGATIADCDIVREPGQVRSKIGFLSANTGIYDRMTPREMVTYYGRLYGIDESLLQDRLAQLFDTLQMTDFADTTGGRLSTGQKQKVSIARAMIHDPPVLIFDEPTSGLDILVQRAVLQTIKRLRTQGKTILFSSHYMNEVEKLCDRIAIMAKGKIAAMGTLDELRKQSGENDLEELFFRILDDVNTEPM